MIILSIALSIFYSLVGMGLSYGPDLPAGAVIILFAGLMYLRRRDVQAVGNVQIQLIGGSLDRHQVGTVVNVNLGCAK